MSEPTCYYMECQNPATVTCQMCKHKFCEEHAKKREYRTVDGRLQYAVLCPTCFQQAIEGKYNSPSDTSRIMKQVLYLAVGVAAVGVGIYYLIKLFV